MREAFLVALSASCNVAASARAAGVSCGMVYRLRRHDDGFAAEWQSALACGYDLLETALVGHALAGGAGTEPAGGDPDMPAIDVEMAMRLLTTHRQRAERGQPRVGQRPKIATREEVNAALLAKLAEAEARVRAAKARRTRAQRAASRNGER